jgi:diguanylate cyclase (GGDEF)-like protein
VDNISTLKGKILVIADNKSVADILKGVIEKFGYVCKRANNLFEASRKIHGKPFDVILTEFKVHDIMGVELLYKVKKQYPESDVLLMADFGTKHSFTHVIKEGATDFITKPFQKDELQARLHRIMRERKLKKELFYLSLRDSLTGLFNRRHFYQTLQHEMERAKRQNKALALVLLDIDNFKQYNDTSGHVEGDKALEKLAKILQFSLRQNVDSAYRYGGDEFAALLIETTMQHAFQIAERIRVSYEREKIGFSTLSLGIAEYKPHFDVEAFVKESDLALYKAKRSGGNQVISHVLFQENLSDIEIEETLI